MELGVGRAPVLVTPPFIPLPYEGASQKLRTFGNHFPIQRGAKKSHFPEAGEHGGRTATTSVTCCLFLKTEQGSMSGSGRPEGSPKVGRLGSAPKGRGGEGQTVLSLTPQSPWRPSNGAVKFTHF